MSEMLDTKLSRTMNTVQLEVIVWNQCQDRCFEKLLNHFSEMNNGTLFNGLNLISLTTIKLSRKSLKRGQQYKKLMDSLAQLDMASNLMKMVSYQSFAKLLGSSSLLTLKKNRLKLAKIHTKFLDSLQKNLNYP